MNVLIKSAIALTLTASQAAALSCAPIDMAREFQGIASSDKTYVVLSGTFSHAARPSRVGEVNPQTRAFASKFNGKLLTGGGFTDDIEDVLVTINSNCAGDFCGGVQPDVPYLAFVEQEGRILTLQAEACPTFAFAEPTPEMIQQIEDCAAGNACTPAN